MKFALFYILFVFIDPAPTSSSLLSVHNVYKTPNYHWD